MTQLTEAMIRTATTAQSFERAETYYRQGAIHNTARQGNVLSGDCEGTQIPYYRVRVELDDAGIRSATCTCPYDWGGYCKHIVALLLTYVHQPEQFAVRRKPAELLADLSRDDLAALLAQLLQRQPDLYDWLEGAVQSIASRQVSAEAPRARRARVDPSPYRRQVERILHSLDWGSPSEAYWGLGGMIAELSDVQRTAQEFLSSGDARSALTILMALTETLADEYGNFDDSDADLAGFIHGTGGPLAEAILSGDLDAVERQEIADKLTTLARELQDYGVDEALDVAIAAAVRGWERPPQPIEREREEPEEWEEEWEEEEQGRAAGRGATERPGATGPAGGVPGAVPGDRPPSALRAQVAGTGPVDRGDQPCAGDVGPGR